MVHFHNLFLIENYIISRCYKDTEIENLDTLIKRGIKRVINRIIYSNQLALNRTFLKELNF